MERLRYFGGLQEHIALDILKEYRSIQNYINDTLVTGIVTSIRSEPSLLLISQQLTTLHDIQTHLFSHLVEEYHTVYAALRDEIQVRVGQQNTAIKDAMWKLQTGDDQQVGEISLARWLALNFEQFQKVSSLSAHLDKQYCSLYQEKLDLLQTIVAENFAQFSSWIKAPTSPVPTGIQLCFKVLKTIEGTKELVAYLPSDSLRLKQAYVLLTEKVNQFRKSIETHTVEHNFEAIHDLLHQLNDHLYVDGEFGLAFRLSDLKHTINLIEKHLVLTKSDLQEKVNAELLETNSSISNGYEYIASKVKLLQSARKLEQHLSDPTLLSSFLACLKDKLSENAMRIGSTITNTFQEGKYAVTCGSVSQLNNIAVLAEFTPCILSIFEAFCKMFTSALTETHSSVNQCSKNSDFKQLAYAHSKLEGFLLVWNEVRVKNTHKFINLWN